MSEEPLLPLPPPRYPIFLRVRVDLPPVAQPRARVSTVFSKKRLRNVSHAYTPRNGVKEWKEAVILHLGRYRHSGWTGPVGVRLAFLLPAPKAVASMMRKTKTPILWADGKPDVDNLAKAVLDALNDGGLWGDDAQASILEVAKWYTLGDPPFPVGLRLLARRLLPREAGPDEWLEGRVFP